MRFGHSLRVLQKGHSSLITPKCILPKYTVYTHYIFKPGKEKEYIPSY